MKVEIALEDLDSLEQTACELRYLLLLVEAAIREKRERPGGADEVPLRIATPTIASISGGLSLDLSETEEIIRTTIATLDEEFTTTEVVVRASGLTQEPVASR